MASKRKVSLQAKKARKKNKMDKPSGESRYGLKRRYLDEHGGWGFDYLGAKPWR